MSCPPEFLDLVDAFIPLATERAEVGLAGEASATIPFAAGRYNAFNFVSDLDGVLVPVTRPHAQANGPTRQLRFR